MDSLLGMIFLFAFGHPLNESGYDSFKWPSRERDASFYTLLSDRLSARRVRRSL